MAKVAIDQIEVIEANRVRVKIDQGRIDEYAEAIKAGAIIPAIVCFCPKNAQRIILADGEQRLLAATQAGRKVIGVDLKEGGVHEARHYALGSNADHGLDRTRADKRHAVQMAFDDPHYDECSLREIAEICRVSHMLVRDMKAEQNEKVSDETVSSYSNESVSGNSNRSVTPRPRKAAPTLDQTDRKELMGALATIKSFAYDGAAAYARLELVSLHDELAFAYDWISEALDEHKVQEGGT